MVADIKIKANTIEVTNYIKFLQRKIPSNIQKGLSQASAFAVQQITDKTQKGKMPDGGRFKDYSKGYKNSKEYKKKKNKFVDLTLSGRMYRSLTFKATRNKSSLFFRRQEEDKKAFWHDTGVGKMPQRPFFAIGRRDEDKIRDIFFRVIKV